MMGSTHDSDTILWRSIRWAGHEAARVAPSGAGWRLEGVAAFAQEGEPVQLRYVVDCDAGWVTRHAEVEGWVGAHRVDVAIEASEGRWKLNGAECPGVAGCIDVDLNFSPSTNLLPIRRLALTVGQSANVRAAWLRFPRFVLEPIAQTYTRTAERTYAYRSESFEASLDVTPGGLVRDYGGVWTAEVP
jgi:hypothetical protein